jgi:hypothetical protein
VSVSAQEINKPYEELKDKSDGNFKLLPLEFSAASSSCFHLVFCLLISLQLPSYQSF